MFFNKFDRRLFKSKFSQFAFYLSLSLSVISKSLAQLCCKCCNYSISVVVNVRLATNGMYVKNNTHINVSQISRNRMSTTFFIVPNFFIGIFIAPCCHSVKLCICCLGFPITTKWCFDQDVKVQPSQKECAIGAVHCKKEGALLQPLR